MGKEKEPFQWEWPDGEVRQTMLVEAENGNYLVPVDVSMTPDKKNLYQKIRDKMKDWFKGTTDKEEEEGTEVTTEAGDFSGFGGRGLGMAGDLSAMLNVESTRTAKYRDYDRMFEEQAELRRALTVTVSNVFSSREGDHETYELKAEGKIQSTLEALEDRTEMKEILPGVCSMLLRYGDEFEEPVFNQNLEIMRLKWLNPKFMARNEDEHGRLLSEQAFTMRIDGTQEINFKEWQVIHSRHDYERGNKYGTSFFAPARKYYRYLNVAEDGMLVGLVTRSTDQTVYMIPTPKNTADEEAERLIAKVTRKMKKRSFVDPSSGKLDWRNHPLADNEDIYVLTNKDNPADVRRLGASNVASQLPVVEYFQNKMFTATGVPKSYLGIERDVNSKATLSWQDVEYSRMVRGIQKEMASFQRQLYNLQLVAAGITPDRDSYEIEYPPISFIDEEMKTSVQQIKWTIAAQAKQLNIPMAWILGNIIGLADEDVKELLPEIEAANAANPNPGAPNQQAFGGFQGKTVEQFQNDVRVQRKLSELRDMIVFIRKNGLTKPIVC